MSHHDQTAAGAAGAPSSAVQTPPKPLNIWPEQENDQGEEYLVDIDTHQTVLVRNATSPEDAVVKAVTGNPEGPDGDLDVVAHDVHVCIHSGIIDGECEHENHLEE